MPNEMDAIVGFESIITQSDNDRDQWGPGGYYNPNTTEDEPAIRATYADAEELDNAYQNPGTLIPGRPRVIATPNHQLLRDSDAVESVASDRTGFRIVTLTNTRSIKIAQFAPFRKRLILDYSLITAPVFIGQQTSCENFANNATSIPQGAVLLLAVPSATVPHQRLELTGANELWAICPGAVNQVLMLIDETWNGETQIG